MSKIGKIVSLEKNSKTLSPITDAQFVQYKNNNLKVNIAIGGNRYTTESCVNVKEGLDALTTLVKTEKTIEVTFEFEYVPVSSITVDRDSAVYVRNNSVDREQNGVHYYGWSPGDVQEPTLCVFTQTETPSVPYEASIISTLPGEEGDMIFGPIVTSYTAAHSGYTATKTYAELLAAINQGKSVIGKCNNFTNDNITLNNYSVGEDTIYISGVDLPYNGIVGFEIDINNDIEYFEIPISNNDVDLTHLFYRADIDDIYTRIVDPFVGQTIRGEEWYQLPRYGKRTYNQIYGLVRNNTILEVINLPIGSSITGYSTIYFNPNDFDDISVTADQRHTTKLYWNTTNTDWLEEDAIQIEDWNNLRDRDRYVIIEDTYSQINYGQNEYEKTSSNAITFYNQNNVPLDDSIIYTNRLGGIVSRTSIVNGNLVIEFTNGETQTIPIASIFDADNYYTKTQSDDRFDKKVLIVNLDDILNITNNITFAQVRNAITNGVRVVYQQYIMDEYLYYFADGMSTDAIYASCSAKNINLIHTSNGITQEVWGFITAGKLRLSSTKHNQGSAKIGYYSNDNVAITNVTTVSGALDKIDGLIYKTQYDASWLLPSYTSGSLVNYNDEYYCSHDLFQELVNVYDAGLPCHIYAQRPTQRTYKEYIEFSQFGKYGYVTGYKFVLHWTEDNRLAGGVCSNAVHIISEPVTFETGGTTYTNYHKVEYYNNDVVSQISDLQDAVGNNTTAITTLQNTTLPSIVEDMSVHYVEMNFFEGDLHYREDNVGSANAEDVFQRIVGFYNNNEEVKLRLVHNQNVHCIYTMVNVTRLYSSLSNPTITITGFDFYCGYDGVKERAARIRLNDDGSCMLF